MPGATNGTNGAAPTSQFTVAVAGGGIAGLALAIGLLKQGVKVAVYERGAASAEIGAGLGIGPNSAAAIKLLDEGLYDAYLTNGTQNGWDKFKSTWFTFRHGERNTDSANDEAQDIITRVVNNANGRQSVHRAHMLDAMVKLVPQEVMHYNKRVVDVGKASSGTGTLLQFDDGTSATADVVVGCDGVKSVIRRTLLGEDAEAARPRFTSKYAYRGVVPMDQAVQAVGDEMARNSQMYLGHDGHILTFPIQNGQTLNIVAFRTKPDGKWEDPTWVVPSDQAAMRKDYAGWNRPVQAILNMIQHPDVWALFEYPPASTYVSTSPCIALLGDAAHASTPHQGAGAGMAFEDAYILSSLLGSIKSHPEPAAALPAALTAYDTVRRPRTQKLVTTSREAGMLYEFQMDGVGDDEEKVSEKLQTRMRWIWEVDLHEQLEAAKATMGTG